MAAGRIFIPGWMPALDRNGVPIPDARMFVYENETDVLATIYTDDTLTTPAANPVEANSSGRFPAVWADDADLFSVSMEAPYGPAGVPFTYDGLSPSMSADLLTTAAAEAAADEAAASAIAAAEAAAEVLAAYGSIEDIEAAVAAANEGAALALEAVNQALAIYGSIEAVEAAAAAASDSADAAAQSAAAAEAAMVNKADRDLSNVTNENFLAFEGSKVFVQLDPSDVTGVANSAKLNAACAAAQGKDLIVKSGIYPMRGTINDTGVNSIDGQDSVFDFSSRVSSGNLFISNGSLNPNTIPLLADAPLDTHVLSLASVLDISPGTWLLISSDQVDYEQGSSSQTYGEWGQVETITGSGPYTVTLKGAIWMGYTVAENAKVQVINVGKGCIRRNMTIIGTGQTYSDGGQNSGDHGANWVWCDRAQSENVRIIRANRNAFRTTNCRIVNHDKWFTEFQVNLTPSEIQYGMSIAGASDKVYYGNGYCLRGRHGADTGVNAGFRKEVTAFNNTYQDTYSLAVAEHSGTRNATYMMDTIYSCGGGYSIRGRGGRTILNPRIRDCYNGAVNGEAFAMSDYAGDITIVEADVDNVRYLGTSATAAYADNCTLGKFTVRGGTFRRYAIGFSFIHNGGPNPGGTGFNTAVGGMVSFEGAKFYCAHPYDGSLGPITSSTLPIEVSGYFRDVRVKGCHFEFEAPVTPGFAVVMRGVTNTFIDDNTFINARGVAVNLVSVTDGTGSPVNRLPAFSSVSGNNWIGIVTDTVPVVTSPSLTSTVWRINDNFATNVNLANTFYTGTTVPTLTIASGIITLPVTGGTSFQVDTQSGAATDDLDTINGGVEGMTITLNTVNNARDVTVKRLTGNIVPGAADVILTNVLDRITLRYNGSQWVAIADINNG